MMIRLNIIQASLLLHCQQEASLFSMTNIHTEKIRMMKITELNSTRNGSMSSKQGSEILVS